MSKLRIVSGAIAALALSVICAPVFAADLGGRPRAEPIDNSPPVRLYPWRGFYVGINGGYAWGDTGSLYSMTGTTATTTEAIDPSGFLGGGQVGYNAQFGNFVIGIEADVQGGNVEGSAAYVNGFTISDELNWLATLRGRLGFAMDRVLFYGTAGVAWADIDTTVSSGTQSVGDSATGTGYVVGGGVEWMLQPNWTLKAEYLYTDIGEMKGTLTTTTGTTTTTTDTTYDEKFHILRAGLNYKF